MDLKRLDLTCAVLLAFLISPTSAYKECISNAPNNATDGNTELLVCYKEKPILVQGLEQIAHECCYDIRQSQYFCCTSNAFERTKWTNLITEIVCFGIAIGIVILIAVWIKIAFFLKADRDTHTLLYTIY
ncbi:Hypothetical predicted protein [Cloeon dipterum]|uniref:Uncharacterized protein n=1 Tax=Cloeon dipterum TaxID=197152 RepID=A0A8S1BKK4_9INSE|nr:Hypothetical predicted protein [Cloeon dipterum]